MQTYCTLYFNMTSIHIIWITLVNQDHVSEHTPSVLTLRSLFARLAHTRAHPCANTPHPYTRMFMNTNASTLTHAHTFVQIQTHVHAHKHISHEPGSSTYLELMGVLLNKQIHMASVRIN